MPDMPRGPGSSPCLHKSAFGQWSDSAIRCQASGPLKRYDRRFCLGTDATVHLEIRFQYGIQRGLYPLRIRWVHSGSSSFRMLSHMKATRLVAYSGLKGAAKTRVIFCKTQGKRTS